MCSTTVCLVCRFMSTPGSEVPNFPELLLPQREGLESRPFVPYRNQGCLSLPMQRETYQRKLFIEYESLHELSRELK